MAVRKEWYMSDRDEDNMFIGVEGVLLIGSSGTRIISTFHIIIIIIIIIIMLITIALLIRIQTNKHNQKQDQKKTRTK